MKFLSLFLVLCLTLTACDKMENSPEAATPEKVILATADKLNNAVLSQDFKTFADHTHPKILEDQGGREKFIQNMANGAKNMNEAGGKLLSITNGEPGKIVKMKDEWQTTLPQTVEMQVPKGRVRMQTTLIAFSNDNGKTWRFVDTFNADLNVLRQRFPNLSKELVIPPAQQPQFVE
jgi:hypothetical protein